MKSKISDAELQACIEGGMNNETIAANYGMSVHTVKNRKVLMARKGISPEHDWVHGVPQGYMIRGVSTQYDKDGNIMSQWVKSKVDLEQQLEIIRQVVAGMNDDITRQPPIGLRRIPAQMNQQLLNLFVLTDYHLGMLSWGEESGEDYDVKIAEDLAIRWLEAAIDRAPSAGTAVLAQLGDFLHWDGLDAVTPSSGHVLDADTRFEKLVRVAIRVIRRIINRLLETHSHVHVICAEGNHDMASSIWLREMLSVLYENEPRLTVDTNPDPYYCVQHGKVTLFFHHGHKSKMGAIDAVFAAKFRKEFGESTYSYAHMGHLHHAHVKESGLMVVEQHRTLAAKDAYASRGGWLSGRSAPVITYHSEFGEVARATISPEMVK